jgi:hypothetical protein
MPLIHDNPWLVSQLLQAISDEENKISKKGQAAPAESPVAAGLTALLNNLRNQITPLKEDPNKITTDVAGGADLASHHMDSLGDLVEWLVAHGTKIGGKVVVYPGNITRPSEDYGYFKIEPGTEIVVPMERPDRTVKAYWISADALKQYLVSLQGDAKLKNNVVFQVQLLKLIQYANTQLDANISEDYKEPTQELAAETVMDSVAPSFDERGWANGNVQLLAKDLASADDWRTWLGANKISTKEGDTTVTSDTTNFDLCAALNALFARAQWKARGSRNPAALGYVKKLTEIAGQMQCNLTGQTQGQGQSQRGGTASTENLVDTLTQILPFDSNIIKFDQITMFVNKYSEWINSKTSSQDPEMQAQRTSVNQTKQNVLANIAYANKLMKDPGQDIQLNNANPQLFQSFAQQPNQAKQLAMTLRDVITGAGRMYTTWTAQFEHMTNSAAASTMQQQISPGGPQQNNLFILNQLIEILK